MSTPLSKIEPGYTALNISALKLGTAEGARSQLEAHLLQDIADAIVGIQTFELALDTALQHVCQSMNWVFAEAWVPNSAQTQLECSRAWYSCKGKPLGPPAKGQCLPLVKDCQDGCGKANSQNGFPMSVAHPIVIFCECGWSRPLH
jgi:hypothetical protein